MVALLIQVRFTCWCRVVAPLLMGVVVHEWTCHCLTMVFVFAEFGADLTGSGMSSRWARIREVLTRLLLGKGL